MLRGIRKASENWLGRGLMAAVMAVLAGSFAIWGINDIFRGFGRTTLAKIGDAEIPIESFEIFATGIDHPECVAFDCHGDLWAGGEAGQIYRTDAVLSGLKQAEAGKALKARDAEKAAALAKKADLVSDLLVRGDTARRAR